MTSNHEADRGLIRLNFTTVDGQRYAPSTDKFLTCLFAQLEREGFGRADGASFTAYPGCEEFAAVRLEMLIGER